jgi:hypothetical protein
LQQVLICPLPDAAVVVSQTVVDAKRPSGAKTKNRQYERQDKKRGSDVVRRNHGKSDF